MAFYRVTLHVVVLEVMSGDPPPSKDPNGVPRWYPSSIADRAGYRSELVGLCLAGLINTGLARALDTYGGASHEITEFGRTTLEVVTQLNEERPGSG